MVTVMSSKVNALNTYMITAMPSRVSELQGDPFRTPAQSTLLTVLIFT
jgi:hypothetical protein